MALLGSPIDRTAARAREWDAAQPRHAMKDQMAGGSKDSAGARLESFRIDHSRNDSGTP
jgi:hypothetical protein